MPCVRKDDAKGVVSVPERRGPADGVEDPPLAGSKNEPPIVAITIVMITADQFACSRVRANEAMAMPTAEVKAAKTATMTSIAP